MVTESIRTFVVVFLLLAFLCSHRAIANDIRQPAVAESPITLQLTYPGRHQSRIVLQGLLLIPFDLARPTPVDGEPSYVFEVDGDILRRGESFDPFRYRFEIPVDQIDDKLIPLVIHRNLRPGDYALQIKLTNHAGQLLFEADRSLDVPSVPPADPISTDRSTDRSAEDLLREANRTTDADDVMVRIDPLPDHLLTGRHRIGARVDGDVVSKVRFSLDGKPLMSKSRPPYSVEIDLGSSPRRHWLVVEALGAGKRILARDRVLINGGPHRFAIRLVEPQPGKRYDRSLRAVAEIDLPRGEALDRVDFFLNEKRIARLYQPPWILPVVLPQEQRISYIRVVAVLRNGATSEDLVLINAPAGLDRLQVNMVELFVNVNDRQGNLVPDLESEDFEVFDEGTEQKIVRFDFVRELPIHAGLLLDTSTSMEDDLADLVAAANRFFQQVLESKDRAAVLVFNDSISLRVPLTNDSRMLADGLEGLECRGDTALYDALVESLYYFSGLNGKRALVVISDGSDSASRFGYDDALEFAQRSGIAVYPVVIGRSSRGKMVRGLMLRLARETGGKAFFLSGVRGIDRIYTEIEEELRSQYFLAYQSNWERAGKFRRVEVRTRHPRLKASTVPGYYP